MEGRPVPPHRIAGTQLQALQTLVWPGESPVDGLVQRSHGVHFSGREARFAAGGRLDLDTAHNVFPLAKWRLHAGLTDLRLVVAGEGRLTLTIAAEADPGDEIHPARFRETAATRSPPRTERQSLTLTQGTPVILDMRRWLGHEALLLHLRFEAAVPAKLTQVTWASADLPRRLPHLALSITTFHREAAVQGAIARFIAQQGPLSPHLDLIVVDNGQSLPPIQHPKIHIHPNRNLGGSGGFARGLTEARALGASHVLFMDDDAALSPSAIARIWTFLAHAKDPATAVAGALMSAEYPHELWENGATFYNRFMPLARCRDLTDLTDLLVTESISLKPQRNFYGGFWAFAFPIAAVRRAPFPFFVRGDDTSFCIMNPFRPVTLPGVLSHQDVDFTEKESPLTLYLDLRSNLIHLATLPQKNRLSRGIALTLRYFGRSLMMHQTDSLRSLNLAMEDFLAGPEALEPDLAQRRAAIAQGLRHEIWQNLTDLPPERRTFGPGLRGLFALGLNGLLLPFFGLWGNRVILPQNQRGVVRPCWGACEVIYVSTDGQRMMRLPLDRRASLTEGLRMVGNLVRLVAGARRLRRAWAKGYEEMTRETWWQGQFADQPKRD
jgi:hypothetical protein